METDNITAIYLGTSQTHSKSGWARTLNKSKSNVMRLCKACRLKGCSDQETIDYIVKSAKIRNLTSSDAVKMIDEQAAMDKCADVARRFLFPNGHLI